MHAFCPIILVINVPQLWPQYYASGYAISDWPPAGPPARLGATVNKIFSLAVQTVFSVAHFALVQSVVIFFSEEIIGNCVSSLARALIKNIHCSVLSREAVISLWKANRLVRHDFSFITPY